MILWKTFFVWSTLHNDIAEYRKNLQENIFTAIELMKQPYLSVMMMPVKRFKDLIKWKSEVEEERQKIMKEEEARIKSSNKKR